MLVRAIERLIREVTQARCKPETQQLRRELWEETIHEKQVLSLVDTIASEVTLEDIPRVTKAMLKGQTRGRVLIRMNDE